MKWCILLCLVLALCLLSGATADSNAQGTANKNPIAVAPKPPKPQFFAGQVIEADSAHVKVARNLLGRAPETRDFVLDNNTKTPKGGIKLKTRVTVRYEHQPERDLALEIQVRPLNHTPKTS